MTKLEQLKQLVSDLDSLQWLPAATIADNQSRDLASLVHHHAEFSPQFKQRLEENNLMPSDIDDVHKIKKLPLLSKRDIQTAGTSFYATEIPESDQPTGMVKTSGSTGETITVQATNRVAMWYHANTMREQQWHARDPMSKITNIRAHFEQYAQLPNWGQPFTFFSNTGPMQAIPIRVPLEQQADLIRDFGTNILMSYPNSLSALCDVWKATGFDVPTLKHLRSIGETVTDAVRDTVRSVTGLEIVDVYSSQEAGNMAAQCPDSGLYHVMSENIIMEIIGDDDQPVGPGETGRVIITDLHNFASPMIRYDIGDWAEACEPCKCGRGLMTFRRVMGRNRNMLQHPDGTRNWPMVGYHAFDTLDFIVRKFQVIQQTLLDIDYNIVTDHPLTAEQEAALLAIAQSRLGAEFNIRVIRHAESWPILPNGKHEEFICRVKP
jgi:phenylacetate-CoA ligase